MRESIAHRAEALIGAVVRDSRRQASRAFRLDGLLGAGGTGAVYAATRDDGAHVAVKILHGEYAQDAEIRGRFEREADVARAVDHPGICRFVDEGVDATGVVFLVVELATGHTVRDRWLSANKHLGEDEVLYLAETVTDVLTAVHARGIIHRDLKPENLFIEAGGRLRVLDFGLAKMVSGDAQSSEETSGGRSLGTPAFLPPEQARGLAFAVDARADVFALGATMFTLLTGEHVHAGTSSSELLLAAGLDPARPIRSIAPSIRPDVAAIVDRALAFEVRDRFADAAAMRAAIQAVRAQRHASASQPEAAHPSSVPSRGLVHSSAQAPVPRGDVGAQSTRDPRFPSSAPVAASIRQPSWAPAKLTWAALAIVLLGGSGWALFVRTSSTRPSPQEAVTAAATPAAAPADSIAPEQKEAAPAPVAPSASATSEPAENDAPTVASASASPRAKSKRRRHGLGELR